MDFNGNVARKIEEPRSFVNGRSANVKVHPQTKTVSLSKFEILSTIVCSAIIAIMMLTLVSAKISLANSQRELQNVQTSISKVNSDNTSQQQEISALTSQSNLKKIAQKYGFKDSNTNVRNVNK